MHSYEVFLLKLKFLMSFSEYKYSNVLVSSYLSFVLKISTKSEKYKLKIRKGLDTTVKCTNLGGFILFYFFSFFFYYSYVHTRLRWF
jgi:hypothetical protein